MKTVFCEGLLSLFVILFVTPDAASGFRLNTVAGGGACEQATRKAIALERASVILLSPERLHGKWVSEGCETRPGPEFLLRSYTFHPNDTFRLVQHYYEDESCSTPGYTVVAKGKMRKAGTYSLSKVAVIPHNVDVAHHLYAKVDSTCPGIVRKRWRPYKEYLILSVTDETSMLNFRPPFTTTLSNQESHHSGNTYINGGKKQLKHPENFNCLHALSLVFHELQHYKVRIKPGTDSNFDVTHYRLELLLGDIHSRLDSRANYKPSSFQVPLLKIDSSVADTLGFESDSLIRSDSLLNIDPKGVENTRGQVYEKSYIGHFDVGRVGELDSIISSKVIKEEMKIEKQKKKEVDIFHHCLVCSSIAMATDKAPPYLMAKPLLPLHIGGEWVSLHCENRPMGLYLTRHFRFYPGDHTWIVEYKFYGDTICSSASFSVTAAGHYKAGKANQHIRGGTEVDFHVERASLIVFDPNMMENLKQDTDCGVGPWKIGVPREMSSTHGCTILGLIVPSIEYELLRMEVDVQGSPMLYMGQADTDNRRRDAKDRPTAYQPALVQCQVLPPHSESLKEILSSPLYSDYVYSSYDPRVLAMELADSGSISNTLGSANFMFFVIFLFFSL